MNLKDLNKIDIKDLQNIDWSEIRSQLQSQPTLAVNVLLVIITPVIMISNFNNYRQAANLSNQEIQKLEEQVSMAEEYDLVKKSQEDFLKNVPKAILSDQLIQKLSELAIIRDVQILSVSPAQEIDNRLVGLTSVEINIASREYANLVLFMQDIEESEFPIRIKKWLGSYGPLTDNSASGYRRNRRDQTNKDETPYIKATIIIESVNVKNA